MIPKIIHQTWKNDIIPDEWKYAVDSCKNIYKDYKYMLWTDKLMDDFVKTEYPEFYNTYISYTYHIQRCDAFRYLVLYKYGGMYIDMDIICKKAIDKLLKYDIVLTKSSNTPIFYTNCFFMTVPNNPFIKYCIDNLSDYMNSFYFTGKHLHVMNSTGPIFLTKMIYNYDLNHISNSYILSKKEFVGECNVCNFDTCEGGDYFGMVEGNSWHSIDSTCYNYVHCNSKKIAVIIIIIILTIFIFYKSYNYVKSLKNKS